MPKFSIVIPVYNREREIRRAVGSCRVQDFPSFEVVVVDDGSTDASSTAVGACLDHRVKLLRHEVNRGHGPARNTGVQAASGEWIIFLDSDDELLPGALDLIHQRVEGAGQGVERLAFMFRRDDGRVSPLPPFRDEAVDYPSYLAWLEGRKLYDFLPCTKRFTFETVRYAQSRWTDHSLYHLDFAKHYRTLFCRETAALVHTDAANRASYARRERRNSLGAAAELGMELDQLLSRHGEAMREFAPRTFQMYRRMRAVLYFLAGHRSQGLKQMLHCLEATPLLPEAWFLLILGITHRGALAAARSWRAPAT